MSDEREDQWADRPAPGEDPDAVGDTGEHAWGGSILARDERGGYDDHAHDAGYDDPDHHDPDHDHAYPEEHRNVRPRRTRSAASCLVVLLVVGAVVAALGFGLVAGVDKLQGAFASADDYAGEGTGSVVFEVKEGETVAAIGRNLKSDGVVASVEAFTDAAASDPDANSIQVGFYDLNEEMSAESALAVLVDPENLLQAEVTVPEGLRVEDVLKTLAKGTEIPLADYQAAIKRDQAIGLPAFAKGNPEGYLFPATYAVPPNADAVDVLSMMVERWQQAAEEADLVAAAEELGYTPGELMIIASLVESEANRDEDRGKVARVIYNRLETDETGGLLQIDATVNYALGRDLGLGLTPEDLDVDSPYNTRKFPGLPPGPIESPGDKAIAAATTPTEGPWLYYVTVNLDTGETKFTDDYDEFLRFKNVELAAYCDGSDRC
ncbi:endolytic transglycosylase MltG [Nocardioides sp. HDW12B]|uniref:endolytic transglycosylase MltG n=1 Tax=Nocardioides sp. HDW12B TaxID=2714939 RepID=UPI00140756E4|nr:endolytic transglycosylase MltG [Nocardioides sp. HDW12B]QIK66624.1 endolytic transglycosylase MltG [Nocardioides sp. HDW12B]